MCDMRSQILKSEDSEKHRWQNATMDMLDEFDKDKIKYMLKPAGHDLCVMGFSKEIDGKSYIGSIVLTKAEIERHDQILEIKKAQLKKEFDNIKK